MATMDMLCPICGTHHPAHPDRMGVPMMLSKRELQRRLMNIEKTLELMTLEKQALLYYLDNGVYR